MWKGVDSLLEERPEADVGSHADNRDGDGFDTPMGRVILLVAG